MSPITKKLVLAALNQYRGDDLIRARARFKGKSKKQMQAPYGASGQTYQQILDDYERREAEIDAAIDEVERL